MTNVMTVSEYTYYLYFGVEKKERTGKRKGLKIIIQINHLPLVDLLAVQQAAIQTLLHKN